jgi:hypothetical protein
MDITKVTKSSNTKTYSLRTTIPKFICKILKVKEADHLIWKEEEGKVIILNQNER